MNNSQGHMGMLTTRISQYRMLRQERSRATEQSHGQSLATAPYYQTKCPKPSNETIKTGDKQPQAQPSVQAVMAPMSQPVGGWHVTSMTKHRDDQTVHDQARCSWNQYSRLNSLFFNESG